MAKRHTTVFPWSEQKIGAVKEWLLESSQPLSATSHELPVKILRL